MTFGFELAWLSQRSPIVGSQQATQHPLANLQTFLSHMYPLELLDLAIDVMHSLYREVPQVPDLDDVFHIKPGGP